jgi:hypothetical protein
MSMSSIVSNRRLRHLPLRVAHKTPPTIHGKDVRQASNLPEQRASAGTNGEAAHAAMSA